MDKAFGADVSRDVRREGAPNYSRGGCAPRTDELHRSGLEKIIRLKFPSPCWFGYLPCNRADVCFVLPSKIFTLTL